MHCGKEKLFHNENTGLLLLQQCVILLISFFVLVSHYFFTKQYVKVINFL